VKTPLWVPSNKVKQRATITSFMALINRRYGISSETYAQLHEWSVENIPDFWAAMWSFAEIKTSRPYDRVVEDLGVFPGTRWFPGARLNFAENLLRHRDDRPALIFHGETQRTASLSYQELHHAVAQLAQALRGLGLKPGDRVAAYMPNMIQTVVAMLAATSVGAVWSSCATDIGPQAALERLGQLRPRVLFTVDGYFYRGKVFDCLRNAASIATGIPSIEKTVVVPYVSEHPKIDAVTGGVLWDDFLVPRPSALAFEQLPFDHPA
jgi:acetoacetyl-CoA synthetase